MCRKLEHRRQLVYDHLGARLSYGLDAALAVKRVGDDGMPTAPAPPLPRWRGTVVTMPSLLDASLSPTERRVLDHFVEMLREQVGLQAVWLYGSRARGEGAALDSDVDLLVITEDRKRDKWVVRRLLYEAAEADRASPALFSAQVWDPGVA